jgi:MFS family permease
MIASLISGLSSAFTVPIAMIFAGELFSAAGAGLAVGLTGTTGQIASSLSGPLFGYTLDSTGSFFIVWGLALVFSTVRILCLLPIAERRTVSSDA